MGKANLNLKFFCKVTIALFVLLCSSTALQAQTIQNWKEKEITLRVSNQPLGKVLEMVAEAAGAKITLQEVSLWNINKATSIAVKNKPLDKVLDDLVADIRFQQRHTDLTHGLLDIGFLDAALAAQLFEGRVDLFS